MKFQVTPQHLAHVFPKLNLNHERLVQLLNLDLGHLQLLRDGYQSWEVLDESVWLLFLALVDAVNNGSLCLDLNQPAVLKKMQKLGVNKPSDVAEKMAAISLKLNNKSVVAFDKSCLYFSKYNALEHRLANTLEQLISKHAGPVFTAEQVAEVAKQVTDDLDFPSIEDKQVLAIVVSLLKPFSIISGGPGTGKTTIMSSVLRGLMALGFQPGDVALSAPTGRAANRMTESLQDVLTHHIKKSTETDAQLMQIEAQTIHRLLGARAGRRGFRYGESNLLTCKVLVVDEVSMVDVALMSQLLSAVPIDCRVILLGDQFQLPSVDVGAVLADLMPPVGAADHYSKSMLDQLSTALTPFKNGPKLHARLEPFQEASMLTDHVTVLETSKRSQPEIAQVAELVRLGQSTELFNQNTWQDCDNNSNVTEYKSVRLLRAADSIKVWQSHYLQWVQAHYLNSDDEFRTAIQSLNQFDENNIEKHKNDLNQLFKVINSNRILTLVNDSSVGAVQINEHIAELMKKRLASFGLGNRFHGSVIMLRKNNAALNLFNGDVGILLAASNGQLRAVLPYKGGYQSHSIHVLPEFTSAYAITVHKSQGSEYAHVLLALPEDENHRLLCREIIYTGITRAKQSVDIYSQPKALKAAIEKQTTRHSGLRLWYNEST